MSLHWKMHTNFPFTRVFVLGIILFFLGLASMIISIIAFVTQSWGHYVGTGMWGGATILASGLTAVFVSRLKSLASVKTFCTCSLIGTFTSLTMLILSAGGLTLSSGFYGRIDPSEYNKRTSNLVHASLLVISVFCLSGNVLALIVCCKYIFFEHHDKPKHRRHHRNMSEGSFRTSNSLRGGAPNTSSLRSGTSRSLLQNEAVSRRHSDNADVNRVQIEYRRSHRRTASDQLHSNNRRHRYSHELSSNNNNNILSVGGVKFYPDRRITSNRNSSQAREVRPDNKEVDRLNIIPLRQGSGSNNRACTHSLLLVQTSRVATSESPKVRLPTEFDEEELPPYEVVESRDQLEGANGSDSGDESDTENSSSTDAHSYNAGDFGDEGAESVPMVEIRVSRSDNQQPLIVQSQLPSSSQTSSSQNRSQHGSSQRSSDFNTSRGAGAMIVRKDSNRSNRPVLSYVNTQSIDELGDYEHLLSVSPEVCAITGESPESVQGAEGEEHHVVNENFYENGPCYENVKCLGQSQNETGMNFLSKSSPSNLATSSPVSSLQQNGKKTSNNISGPSRKVSVQIISRSSPTQNTSPHSPQTNFGSTLSAFRPVGAVASGLASHSICSPSHQSRSPQQSNEKLASSNNLTSKHKPGGCSPPAYSNELQTCSGHPINYLEQGAVPKSTRPKETTHKTRDSLNLSWKNIPLPLSYNHSESVSNEHEKVLPPKTIPFAESKTNISKLSSQESTSSKLSPRVYPLSILNSLSSTTEASASNSPEDAEAAAPQSKPSAASNPTDTTPNSKVNNSNNLTSSVREASTQATSNLSSRWHSHRMGGNQSLLQTRREEIQNSHLSRRAVEASSRSGRPSSMPLSVGRSGISHGISALAPSLDGQSRSENSDSAHPLSLRSYLVNQQMSQSLALRQNHLVQHYPLQPQQPRLGVQLHQRRQQQHQLQQNIESQQQQQLQQQQQQQLHQGAQQPQQARNGRPLFSVLL
ncbi:ras guanine nucleotide exchange factor B-like [Physella acuta]|uniref:ras guanine nucleotide exchange factor B-like n=1 Tax=Physella acuta TaxID=109671 RepID=UPI0027DB5C81|nr:ras guanine nucleotide exchange factor B-like [Physella acuta]